MKDYQFESTEHGAILTKVLTSPTHAVIPEYAEGLPVYAVGKYAFEGQEQLQSVHFPATIQEIQSHAFYNCTNLEHLILDAGVRAVADGAFKSCRALHRITVNGSEHLEQFLTDCTLEIVVTMHLEHGETAVLLFPEYDYIYEEMVQPRGVKMVTYGSGSFYRVCFYRSQIDFAQYDRAFARAIPNDTTETLVTIALLRLQYPYRLCDSARERYLTYITEHCCDAAKLAIKQRDSAKLELILRYELPDQNDIQQLILFSNEEEFPEATSVLMDYRLAKFGSRHARFVL